MKANELMLGDWVETLDGISKVVSIHDAFHVEVEDNDYTYDVYQVSPIPLTEEILKANGFVYKTTDYEKVYQGPTYGKYNLSNVFVLFGKEEIHLASHYGYRGHGDVDAHEYATIFYVHELQHALRLCGLNDLADNFKMGGEK